VKYQPKIALDRESELGRKTTSMLFLGFFKRNPPRETAQKPLCLHLTATSLSVLSTSAYRGIITNADTNAEHLYFRCTTEDLLLDEVDQDDPEENEAQARELLSFLQQASATDVRMGLFKKILRGEQSKRWRRRRPGGRRAVFIAVDSFE
jgi:hypothetical protein